MVGGAICPIYPYPIRHTSAAAASLMPIFIDTPRLERESETSGQGSRVVVGQQRKADVLACFSSGSWDTLGENCSSSWIKTTAEHGWRKRELVCRVRGIAKRVFSLLTFGPKKGVIYTLIETEREREGSSIGKKPVYTAPQAVSIIPISLPAQPKPCKANGRQFLCRRDVQNFIAG